MKRTQADELPTPAFERNRLADQINHIDGRQYQSP
jgi:hypothetical protein